MMKEVGIFRATAPKRQLSALETHAARGNYSYFEEVKSPHVLANYLKQVLREMKEPLIPFDQYEDYDSLGA